MSVIEMQNVRTSDVVIQELNDKLDRNIALTNCLEERLMIANRKCASLEHDVDIKNSEIALEKLEVVMAKRDAESDRLFYENIPSARDVLNEMKQNVRLAQKEGLKLKRKNLSLSMQVSKMVGKTTRVEETLRTSQTAHQTLTSANEASENIIRNQEQQIAVLTHRAEQSKITLLNEKQVLNDQLLQLGSCSIFRKELDRNSVKH